MGGGLMQLVAYGAQDVYLTGNPQITFFKVVYRRHTNFACESIEQTFNGNSGFGGKATATISRNGDLITNMYLQATLPELTGATYVNGVGNALMKSVELEIGGQKIDKHYSEWLDIWSELTLPSEKEAGYKSMVGKYASDGAADLTKGMVYVPLVFFFNRNPGLALPLIALQYHEVKINIEFRALSELVVGTNTGNDTTLDAALYVDYVYLDTDERKRFAQVQHELLIEQLQFTGDESIPAGTTNARVRMNFNHPVKELVFVVQDEDAGLFDYQGVDSLDSTKKVEPVSSMKILLNGHDRFSSRPASYFRLVQPYQHHTRVPAKNVYSYSFALKPEEHQPSGTCNFSRIDNATMSLTMPSMEASRVKVFAVNYNVLRIMSGMGGLAYSN
tara:strand:+ start:5651 stop:6817 length:1167 start_codon:yes stop_codon:yes gene_type:complete